MAGKKDIPDVCIIGAGLAGGVLAYELGQKGVEVVVLEAGPRHDPQDKYAYMEKFLDGGDPWAADIPARDRYTNAGEIAYPLNRYRVKAVGGSTLHWSAVALRLHESDFKMKSLHGLAEDWPVGYDELEPYYVRAEAALGVSGTADNPFASRRSAGYPLPPFPFSYANQVLLPGCEKMGIQMHHVPYARNSAPHADRPQCQAFGTCIPVCPIEAQYNAEVHVRLAEKTGKVTIVPRANAVRINLGRSGLAESVAYATPDKAEHEQRARLFILATHAVESARLLLLSTSPRFPHGLANRSGLVGKNFMEHPYVQVWGKLKQNLFPRRIGFHTAESHQFCVPKKRDTDGAFKLDFEALGPMPVQIAAESGLWGDGLATEVRETFGYSAGVAVFPEQLPREKISITLDPEVKDCFGNPVPRVTYFLGAYEKEAIRKGVARAAGILDAIGATDMGSDAGDSLFCGHHMGTCRMGDDPEKSVVDRDLRTHDVKNLFLAGSSVFVTGGAVNPSLTIVALALRAAETILKNGARA